MAIRNLFTEFLKNEEGQSFAEYALILFLVALAAILVLTTLGTTIAGVFQSVINALTGGGGGT